MCLLSRLVTNFVNLVIISVLFSAHTKESARALVETIKMTFPDAPLALVVAMARDKDHVAFAKEFLSGNFWLKLLDPLSISSMI